MQLSAYGPFMAHRGKDLSRYGQKRPRLWLIWCVRPFLRQVQAEARAQPAEGLAYEKQRKRWRRPLHLQQMAHLQQMIGRRAPAPYCLPVWCE